MEKQVFEIDSQVAERLLDSGIVKGLSFLAKRVLYAGRVYQKWYTKSEDTYKEIVSAYKALVKKKATGKKKVKARKARKARK